MTDTLILGKVIDSMTPFSSDEMKESMQHLNTGHNVMHDVEFTQVDAPIYQTPFTINYSTPALGIKTDTTLQILEIKKGTSLAIIKSVTYPTSNDVLPVGFEEGIDFSYKSDNGVNTAYVSTVTNTKHLVKPAQNIDYTPLHIMIPTNYTSIKNLLVVNNDNDVTKVLVGYRFVRFTDGIRNANTSCILLTYAFNNYILTTVKTKDGGNLNIVIRNSWNNVTQVPIDVTITGTAVIISGSENVSTVIGNQLIYLSDLVTLKANVDTLLGDVASVTRLLNFVTDFVISMKNADSETLGKVYDDIKVGDISVNTIMNMFYILTNFASDVGVPYVKDFANVMRRIYALLNKNGSEPSITVANNSKLIAAYQETNDILISAFRSEEYDITDLEDKLSKLSEILVATEGKYTYVDMYGVSAFGTDSISEFLGQTYGQFMVNSSLAIGKYPTHIWCEVKQMNPSIANDPDMKIIRFEQGINWKTITSSNGLISAFNFMNVTEYTASTVPSQITSSDNISDIFKIMGGVCAYSYDEILSVAKIFRDKWPTYNISANNCQHGGLAFYDTITKGEVGIMKQLLLRD